MHPKGHAGWNANTNLVGGESTLNQESSKDEVIVPESPEPSTTEFISTLTPEEAYKYGYRQGVKDSQSPRFPDDGL